MRCRAAIKLSGGLGRPDTKAKVWIRTQESLEMFLTTSHSSPATAFSPTRFTRTNKSRRPLLILQRASTPTISPQPRRSPIHDKPSRNQQKHKRQPTNPQNLLALTVHNRKSQQQKWEHSNQNRPRHPTRYLKRPPQPRLLNPQHNQSHKLQHQTHPIQKHVNRNQSLKSQPQTKRPARRQKYNRHPRRLRFLLQLAKHRRQQSILRHRQRQSRITHHQRVKHSKRAHHSAQHQSHAKSARHQRPAHQPAHHPCNIRPRSRLKRRRWNSRQPHRRKRQHVSQRNHNHRHNHRRRISFLRTLHLRRYRRSVIPPHIIPHANQQPANQPHARSCRRRHRSLQRSDFRRRNQHNQHERRRKQKEKPQRTDRHHAYSRDIHQRAHRHDAERHHPPAMSHRKPRNQPRQVRHKKRRVNRHIKNTSHQRQPRFLKSPEISHRAPHPRVISALRRQRAGKFANHVRRRQAPDQRRHQQQQNSQAVARAVNDVFGSVRSARHHEKRRGHQRPEC